MSRSELGVGMLRRWVVSRQGGKVAGEKRPRCWLSDQGTGCGVAVWATPLIPSACALPSVQTARSHVRSHVQSTLSAHSVHTMRSTVEGDGI